MRKKIQKKKRPNPKDKPIPMVKPMLATLVDKAFNSPDFIYEIKWDGYRALARIQNGKVLLYSRNLKEFNSMYPAVVKTLTKVRESVLFDGEIVAYDKSGKPSFQTLQNLESNKHAKLEYVIFDILYLNGTNLMNESVVVRKEILRKLLIKYPSLTYGDYIGESGVSLFKEAVKNSLEGILAKRKDSVYIPNFRSEAWLKIKHHKTDEGVIAGFTAPRGGRAHFGALVLGQYRGNDEFIFIGHTGTGFNQKTLESLYKKMKPLIVKTSPFKTKIPLNAPITWVKPQLVAELKFSEWTAGGNMRHPVFLGLRQDKNPKEAQREKIKKIKNIRK